MIINSLKLECVDRWVNIKNVTGEGLMKVKPNFKLSLNENTAMHVYVLPKYTPGHSISNFEEQINSFQQLGNENVPYREIARQVHLYYVHDCVDYKNCSRKRLIALEKALVFTNCWEQS